MSTTRNTKNAFVALAATVVMAFGLSACGGQAADDIVPAHKVTKPSSVPTPQHDRCPLHVACAR